MRKIGFVIPWYGEHEPDGIEAELRELVARLQKAGTEVEVLTTCIQGFRSDWNRNYYAAGTSLVNNILVRRFPTYRRDTMAFEQVVRKMNAGQHLSLSEEQTYIEENINSPQLYEYLLTAEEEYALYVFLPYAFGTTYSGIQIALEKSVMIPCFQDEASLSMRLFRQEYVHTKAMIYHTATEMELAGRVYDFSTTEQICIGAGVETEIQADATIFRKAFQIHQPYLLYVGRKDASKNLPLLLCYFAELKHRHPDSPLQLVLIGEGNTKIPVSIQDDVYDLGYVTEQDKYHAMAAALALCQPSGQERFAPVLMESWLCGRPVLVSARCAVTKDFARRTNGGLYFRNYFEFEGSIQYLLEHPDEANQMGENGRDYVRTHFNWQRIINRYQTFFQKISGEE